MYKIDFKYGSFVISIHIDKFDNDTFETYVSFLKSIYISWDKNICFWKVPYNRIDEVLMWFEKKDYDYMLTSLAKEKFDEFKKNNFLPETKFYRNVDVDFSVLKNCTLFDYQKVGVKWLLQRSRAYLADDAGLGKTIQCIAVISQLYKENKIDSAFIVVRNGLTYNWFREICTYSNEFSEKDIVVIDNKNKIRIFNSVTDKKIIIVPNHLLGDVFASYKKNYDSVKKLSDLKWNKDLVDIKKEWNKNSIALIIDEAHELKNTKAVRTKAIISHKDMFEYRYLLSATPAINRFEDWWSGLHILDKSILSYSENAFKIYISNDIGNKFSLYSIITYNQQRINEVKDKISTYVLKRVKKDLPEVRTKQIIKPIYLAMTYKQQDLYDSFIRNEVIRLKKEYDIITRNLILQKFPYLIQIIDNPELLLGKVQNPDVEYKLLKWKFEEDTRLIYLKNALEDYIENLQEKVIVFDNHPLTLNKLSELFKKYNPLLLHGQLNESSLQRQEKIDLFNDKNSKYKLFLISTQVGGAGLNLHHACRRIIFYTLPYDATLTRQAQDRVYRITSEFDSIVEMLVIDNSIDTIRYTRNVSRIELNDAFLNKELSDKELDELFSGAFLTNK